MFKQALPSIIFFMIIVGAIIGTITSLTTRLSLRVNNEKEYCKSWLTSYYSVSRLPAVCLKYYNK